MKILYINLIILLFFPSIVLATETEEKNKRIKKIFNNLRCPTCQGLSVDDSEAGFSVNIKNKVKEMVNEGASDDKIFLYFTERYGDWILRSPPFKGFNLILWLLPIIIIMYGFWFTYKRIKEWELNNDIKTTNDIKPLTTEEKKRIDSDLRNLEES